MPTGVSRTERSRRAARGAAAKLTELLFGFGVVESLFAGALFVLGARYVPAGPPLILLSFLGLLRLSQPGRPLANRVFVHFFWFVTCFLVMTGLASAVLRATSTPQLLARVMHQAMAVPATLAWVIWIHRHVRRIDTAESSKAVLASGRAAWLALKVSLWSGAVVALLVILEGLIPVHVVALAIATPLVIGHGIVARRWRARADTAPRSAPYLAIAEPGVGRVLATSGLAGVAFAALMTWGPRAYDGINLAVGHERATTVKHADFGAGFAVTESGAGYSPTVLAQSTACGNASCHPFVFLDWKASRHRRTVTSDYLDAVESFAAARGRAAAGVCVSCHDPISELAGVIGETGELTTPEGRREGLSCLTCHSTSVPVASPPRLVFRFPELFGSVLLDARSLVALTPRHRAELAVAPGVANRLCVTCHTIPALAGDLPTRHQQPRMLAECRGDAGCVDCHMPRASRNARPGQPLAPSHRFVATGETGSR